MVVARIAGPVSATALEWMASGSRTYLIREPDLHSHTGWHLSLSTRSRSADAFDTALMVLAMDEGMAFGES
jgi:hypothetical protein